MIPDLNESGPVRSACHIDKCAAFTVFCRAPVCQTPAAACVLKYGCGVSVITDISEAYLLNVLNSELMLILPLLNSAAISSIQAFTSERMSLSCIPLFFIVKVISRIMKLSPSVRDVLITSLKSLSFIITSFPTGKRHAL